MASAASSKSISHRETSILIIAIFIAGLCSIVYELLISTVSSYFLGDTIKQFSLTIGLYMAAMGAGAYLSRFVSADLIRNFIVLEIVLACLGGASVPLLYLCYSVAPETYTPFMICLVLAIGGCIGFEIPLLTRILERYYTLKVNISNVLGIDYFGALIATLVFPFILLPFVGNFRSSLIFGIINLGLAAIVLHGFGKETTQAARTSLRVGLAAAGVLLVGLLAFSTQLTRVWSQSLYADEIIYRKQSPYQEIVLTRYRDDFRLFLNGNLQFSSRDEYRYHETLVHAPIAFSDELPKSVLVLGGGDGLAVRELLKYSSIDTITVVDIDPAVVALARQNPLISDLNDGAFDAPQVTVVHADAFRFLTEGTDRYDLIIADLPDPSTIPIARLYSREFFQLIKKRLHNEGLFITQSTSPYFAPKAFWCINTTLADAGFPEVIPLHTYIPSFGEWGFNIAAKAKTMSEFPEVKAPTRFLDESTVSTLFAFAPDLRPDFKRYETPSSRSVTIKTSTLDDPELLYYYLKSAKNWR